MIYFCTYVLQAVQDKQRRTASWGISTTGTTAHRKSTAAADTASAFRNAYGTLVYPVLYHLTFTISGVWFRKIRSKYYQDFLGISFMFFELKYERQDIEIQTSFVAAASLHDSRKIRTVSWNCSCQSLTIAYSDIKDI